MSIADLDMCVTDSPIIPKVLNKNLKITYIEFK